MNFQLQIRRPHRRYETITSSANLDGLAWGWMQCRDPRYFTGHVRIVDVSTGTLKVVARCKVVMP